MESEKADSAWGEGERKERGINGDKRKNEEEKEEVCIGLKTGGGQRGVDGKWEWNKEKGYWFISLKIRSFEELSKQELVKWSSNDTVSFKAACFVILKKNQETRRPKF